MSFVLLWDGIILLLIQFIMFFFPDLVHQIHNDDCREKQLKSGEHILKQKQPDLQFWMHRWLILLQNSDFLFVFT